jgi:eukaryotic-like serine/threonine-protein kinase
LNDDRFAARVGQTIAGKWQLERLIGVGGMAAVYAARHRVGAPVAIKILHPEVARDSELRQRFEREAMVMGRLEHPGSVEVRDIDVTDDGAPYLVMELLEGESLKERAQRLGGIASDELLGHVDQALDVLAAAHAQGIVHRDIKPDNLFLTHDGVLKVLDFGIARMREGAPMTMIGTRLGTLPYMPPEQVRAVNVDHRADIFALGAVMFRILAKRRIHEAKTESEMLVKMSAEPAPRLATVAPQIPAAICAIVDRALAFEKGDRYPDARTMQADVRVVRAGEAPTHAQAAPGVSGASGPLERPGATALLEPTGHTRAASGVSTAAPAVEPTGHTRVGAPPPASGTAVATPFMAGAAHGVFEATARGADPPPSASPSRAGSNDPALGPTQVAPTDPGDPGTRVSSGVAHRTLVSGPAPQPTQVMAAHSAETDYGAGVEAHGAQSMAMPPPATMSVSEPPGRKPVAAIIFAGIAALLVVGAFAFALGGDDAPKAARGVEDDGQAERRGEDDEGDDTGSGDASGEGADRAKATATSQPGLPSLIDRFSPPDKPIDKPIADKPIADKPAPPNPTAALPIEHLPKPQPAQPPATKSTPPQPTEKGDKDKSKGKGKSKKDGGD